MQHHIGATLLDRVGAAFQHQVGAALAQQRLYSVACIAVSFLFQRPIAASLQRRVGAQHCSIALYYQFRAVRQRFSVPGPVARLCSVALPRCRVDIALGYCIGEALRGSAHSIVLVQHCSTALMQRHIGAELRCCVDAELFWHSIGAHWCGITLAEHCVGAAWCSLEWRGVAVSRWRSIATSQERHCGIALAQRHDATALHQCSITASHC